MCRKFICLALGCFVLIMVNGCAVYSFEKGITLSPSSSANIFIYHVKKVKELFRFTESDVYVDGVFFSNVPVGKIVKGEIKTSQKKICIYRTDECLNFIINNNEKIYVVLNKGRLKKVSDAEFYYHVNQNAFGYEVIKNTAFVITLPVVVSLGILGLIIGGA